MTELGYRNVIEDAGLEGIIRSEGNSGFGMCFNALTGVGLAICRKIVDRHSGTITARSSPGQGATFVVTLPVIQPKELEVL